MTRITLSYGPHPTPGGDQTQGETGAIVLDISPDAPKGFLDFLACMAGHTDKIVALVQAIIECAKSSAGCKLPR